MGWNELREQIFANQKKLGVIPANAQLTPWPDDLKKWDTLSADEKKLFARQAEVFAGYTAYTDYEIGRVIQAVEDMGKLDNTLIIYMCGDNGTSPEGTTVGTFNQYTAYNGILDVPIAAQIEGVRRLGFRQDLPAHGGRMVVGVRYTLQVDQAGGLALRRHSAGLVRSRGPVTSRMSVASAPSSTMSLISCPRSLKPPASGRPRRSTGSSRSRSKA